MGSFGELQLLEVSCNGLRNADAMGKSDPFLKFTFKDSHGVQKRKSRVIDDVNNPVWTAANSPSLKPFKLFERGGEINFQVLDEDPVGEDFLGCVVWDVPDDTELDGEVTLPLTTKVGYFGKEPTGTMTIKYKISYDAKAEMEQAFNSQNVETGNEREQEDVPAPEFNLGVTKDAANRLTKRLTQLTAALNIGAVMDILKYKRPFRSAAAFLIFLFVSWNTLWVPGFMILVAHMIYCANPANAYKALEDMFPAAIKPHLTLIFKFGGLLPLLIYTIFVSIFGGIIITAVIGLLVWDARQPLPGWKDFKGKDTFSGQNAGDSMTADDLDACRKECQQRGCGAFVVWNGTAYFRSQSPKACEENASSSPDANLYVCLNPAKPLKGTKKQTGGGLGMVTQLTHNLANTADYVAELFTWVIPEQTAMIFLACCGGAVGSLVVPIWLLVFLGGIYAFTINAVYMKYPVVAKRYPIGRVIALLMAKVTGKGKPARQWEAAITLTIIEARKLRSADPFNGKPDGFVKVSTGNVMKKTKVVEDNFNPKWNEVLDLGTQTADKEGTVDLQIQIFDQDDIGSYDFLGAAQMTLTSPSTTKETWLTLQPDNTDTGAYITGQLKVKVEMKETGKSKQTQAKSN